jgi:hypothetical protein
MNWEPEEPFNKDDFVKFIKELETIFPTEPLLIKSLLNDDLSNEQKYKMWKHVHQRMMKKGPSMFEKNLLIFEMAVFYKFYYHYKYVETLICNAHKKQIMLYDLKQYILFAKYDCETEYLYRFMHLDPHKTIKTLLKAHNELIDRLENLDYEILEEFYSSIDGGICFGFNVDFRIEQLRFDLDLLIKTVRFVSKFYLQHCIGLRSLGLPNYVILWILDSLNYDSEHFSKKYINRSNVKDFQGFDPNRRKDTKIYLFDCLSQLQKIRMIEKVQSFTTIASRQASEQQNTNPTQTHI